MDGRCGEDGEDEVAQVAQVSRMPLLERSVLNFVFGDAFDDLAGH